MKYFSKMNDRYTTKKFTTLLVIILSILLSFSASAYAITPEPAFLDPSAGEVIFEQMSLGGETGYTSCVSQQFRVTDDFTLSADSDISKIEFMEINQSPNSNTIEKVYLEIYDGNPYTTQSNKVWGDMTTNRMVKSEDTNVKMIGDYYTIHKVTAEIGLSLPAGTYWIVVLMDGPSSSYYWVENGTFGNGAYQLNGGDNRPDMAFRLLGDSEQVKKATAPGNHEIVTLLTNPTDSTGVRTLDLTYYLNDPISWGTDVKNITVWLESEVFDLATAQQKAKLPTGLNLLKDYNIRLMMKITYNDGTVETKEVDNAHIARNIPVLISVDEFAGISDLGIIYMDTQGNIAVLPVTPVTIDGHNYLQFENNHFSEYGVVSGTAQALAQQQQYIIQPGDTLASIAAKFGVTVQSLATANNISNPDMIYAGKALIIA